MLIGMLLEIKWKTVNRRFESRPFR